MPRSTGALEYDAQPQPEGMHPRNGVPLFTTLREASRCRDAERARNESPLRQLRLRQYNQHFRSNAGVGDSTCGRHGPSTTLVTRSTRRPPGPRGSRGRALAMDRKRSLNGFKAAVEVGPYDEFPGARAWHRSAGLSEPQRSTPAVLLDLREGLRACPDGRHRPPVDEIQPGALGAHPAGRLCVHPGGLSR